MESILDDEIQSLFGVSSLSLEECKLRPSLPRMSDDYLIRRIKGPLLPPTKFQRRLRPSHRSFIETNPHERHENESTSARNNRLLRNFTNWRSADDVFFIQYEFQETHRNQPLLSNHRQDSIVAPRPSSSGVDEDVNRVVEWNTRRRLREHHIQVDSPEDLLEGIEGEPGQLRLDQVGPVLHDSLQLEMPVAALPPRDQMEHVRAVSGLPVLPALGAGQSHAEHIEEGEIRGLVTHLDQASVE
jgi:hypothetical protein